MTKFSENFDNAIGEKIREQRKLAGLTMKAMGEKLGISYQQFQKYETGHNRVSAGRLAEIARILRVHPSTFYGPDVYRAAIVDAGNTQIEHGGNNRQSIDLVKNFEAIPCSQTRTQLSKLIKGIAESQRENGLQDQKQAA